MNKFERIQRVRQLGLNTEDCILVTKKEDLVDNVFLEQFTQYSIRTFWKDGNEIRKTPHSAVVLLKDLWTKSCKLLHDGLYLIIKDAIDPKDALFAGAALKTSDEIIIEIANGPVTVREVTHKNNIDERYTADLNKRIFVNVPEPRNLLKILVMKRCLYEFMSVDKANIIFEFSYYNIPVGWKHEQFICWEITPSGHKIQYNKFIWNRYNHG